MGGFFGAVSKRDVVMDVFFGVDYHSHLGTQVRAGMIDAMTTEDGYQRQIHYYRRTRRSARNSRTDIVRLPRQRAPSDASRTPTRSRCSVALAFGHSSLSRPSVPSTMPTALVEEYFEDHDAQFMALSSGAVNSTELVGGAHQPEG